jgi:hypothetical protein
LVVASDNGDSFTFMLIANHPLWVPTHDRLIWSVRNIAADPCHHSHSRSSWFLMCSLVTDCIENTASKSSSVAVFISVAAGVRVLSCCWAVHISSVATILSCRRHITLLPLLGCLSWVAYRHPSVSFFEGVYLRGLWSASWMAL